MTPEHIIESLKAQLRGNIEGFTKAKELIVLDLTKVVDARIEENENILRSIEKMEQMDCD